VLEFKFVGGVVSLEEAKLVPPVKCPYGYNCLCTRCNNKECDMLDCDECEPGAEEEYAVVFCSEFIPVESLPEDKSKR